MLQNYREEMNIGLMEMKDYLMGLSDSDQIERCLSVKELHKLVNEHYQDFLYKGMLSLIEAKGFDAMEHQLIMMNAFFEKDKDFMRMKRKIRKIMLHLNKPLRVYQIVRHIVDYDCLTLIDTLHKKGYMNLSQCAYCCLVEEHADKAYTYLAAMTQRPAERLLDYFHSYSISGYYALLKLYDQRLKEGILWKMNYC